jgi:hypothetical protein
MRLVPTLEAVAIASLYEPAASEHFPERELCGDSGRLRVAA